MRKPSNPFVLSGYHSPIYFCDREEELVWLIEQIHNERNMVLLSWRRMGKTSLVSHLFHHLEKEKKADGILVDLLGTSTMEEANKRIASAIVHRFGDLKNGLAPALLKLLGSIGATIGIDPMNGMPQVTFSMSNSGQSIPGSLEALGRFLESRKKPVVICLDEFQQITNYSNANAEAIFRSWMQDFPMIRFIFSGSHRHMMMSMFSTESRPFYRSVQIKPLEPLIAEKYAPFIQSFFTKANKKLDGALLDKIFEWTKMQTYYVQLVCNKLFAKAEQINNDMLGEVFNEIIAQEVPVFSNYQQLFTNFQWKLLIALAKTEETENPLSKKFLSQFDLGAASSVSSALKTLIKTEFVIYENNKYMLHDTLLMRWLQQL